MAEVGHGMGHGDRRSEWVEVGCGMAEVGHGEVNVFWVSVGESGVAGFGCDAGFFFFFF